jgi:hypothetical protein
MSNILPKFSVRIIGDRKGYLKKCIQIWQKDAIEFDSTNPDICLCLWKELELPTMPQSLILFMDCKSIYYNSNLNDLVFDNSEEETKWIDVCRKYKSITNSVIPLDIKRTLNILKLSDTPDESKLIDSGFMNLLQNINSVIPLQVKIKSYCLALENCYDTTTIQEAAEECIRVCVQKQSLDEMQDIIKAIVEGLHKKVITFGRIARDGDSSIFDKEFEMVHSLAQVVLMTLQYMKDLTSNHTNNFLTLMIKKAAVDTQALYGLAMLEGTPISPHFRPSNMIYYLETIDAYLPESLERFSNTIIKCIHRCIRVGDVLEEYLGVMEHIRMIIRDHSALTKLAFGWLSTRIHHSTSYQELYSIRIALDEKECIAADYLIALIDLKLENECNCWPTEMKQIHSPLVQRLIDLI